MSKAKTRLKKIEKIMKYEDTKIYVIMPVFEGIKRVSVSDGTRLSMKEYKKLNIQHDQVIEIDFI